MASRKSASYNGTLSENGIPIIDLGYKGSVANLSNASLKEIGAKINQGIDKKGLVFLVNHGIPEETLQSVFSVMEKFTSLPDEVKDNYKSLPPYYNQGYCPVGIEKLAKGTKMEKKMNFQIINFTDQLPTDIIPNFKEAIQNLAEKFLDLSELLLKVIAINLELDPNTFLNVHKGVFKGTNLTSMRMLYYPPVDGESLEQVTRCGPHTDWGTLTLLTQDSEGGLEILHDGEWCNVGHLPGALLLNIADMMEMWSSGVYKAVKHRVVVPESEELRSRGRHSIAFFVHPDRNTPLDGKVLSSPEKMAELKSGAIEKPMDSVDYIKYKLNEAFDPENVVTLAA